MKRRVSAPMFVCLFFGLFLLLGVFLFLYDCGPPTNHMKRMVAAPIFLPKEFTLGCFLSAHEGACLHIGKSQPREPSGGVKKSKKTEKTRKNPKKPEKNHGKKWPCRKTCAPNTINKHVFEQLGTRSIRFSSKKKIISEIFCEKVLCQKNCKKFEKNGEKNGEKK